MKVKLQAALQADSYADSDGYCNSDGFPLVLMLQRVVLHPQRCHDDLAEA